MKKETEKSPGALPAFISIQMERILIFHTKFYKNSFKSFLYLILLNEWCIKINIELIILCKALIYLLLKNVRPICMKKINVYFRPTETKKHFDTIHW